MSELVNVNAVTKNFGAFCAVDNLSFSVKKGEVLGFLGPNGAGKTTTMRMIMGYLSPDSGQTSICGYDSNHINAAKHVGYLPEGSPLYPDMTPRMMFDFVCEVRDIPLKQTQERITYIIGILGLHNVMDQAIGTLSKGFKRRVGLALAIIHDPPVLILDEPTDGLDPNQKHDVRTLIKTMAKDKAIIISTHILEEVSAVCTRAIILNKGKLVANDTPNALLKSYKNAATLDDVFRALTHGDAK